jgi:2-phosphoglycerate kinase
MAHTDFQVLLIGGCSGTGKSMLARDLSQVWGIPALQVDDFRLVLEHIVQQGQQSPAGDSTLWNSLRLSAIRRTGELFTRITETPEVMCQALVNTARVMSNAIEIVIAHHVATRLPVIIEGDGILPSLAARSAVAGLPLKPGQLKGLFLVEEDETRLLEHMLQRARGIEQHTHADQQHISRAFWLYGQWLKEEAQRYSLPLISPLPYETLVERVVAHDLNRSE